MVVTFVESSIVAWWRWVVGGLAAGTAPVSFSCGALSLVAVELDAEDDDEGMDEGIGTEVEEDAEVDGRDFVRMVSRFQFALPAVVSNLLLHTTLTPPVSAHNLPISPPASFSSNSLRNASAILSFRAENCFNAARSAFAFSGDGTLEGEVRLVGEVEKSFLEGEWVSFQVLIRSAAQKEGEVERCGVLGMWAGLLGDFRVVGLVGLPGGVMFWRGGFLVGLVGDGELGALVLVWGAKGDRRGYLLS